MDLLKYEFIDAAEGSYDYMLSQLVRLLRFYTTNVPVEEFKSAFPMMRDIEKNLQNFDSMLGQGKRNYIDEIMAELEQEGAVKNKLLEEVERSSKVIIKSLYDEEFLMAELDFNFKIEESIYWFEFQDYSDKEKSNAIKEIIRAICYRYEVIFIDKSSNQLN